jgi:hypothetical protein
MNQAMASPEVRLHAFACLELAGADPLAPSRRRLGAAGRDH